MIIRIDSRSTVPIFEQIVAEVKAAVARGAVAGGEMIPSVRQMAADIIVNPNTVARAYRELERQGIVYTRKGLGVFIADGAAKASKAGRRDEIVEQLKELMNQGKRAGIAPRDLQEMFRRALAEGADSQKGQTQ